MADAKLSELTVALGAGPSDLHYLVQNNVSKRISTSSLALSLSTSIATLNITSGTVATATSTGTIGQVKYNGSYIYFCVATNTWVRHAIDTSW